MEVIKCESEGGELGQACDRGEAVAQRGHAVELHAQRVDETLLIALDTEQGPLELHRLPIARLHM